MDIFGLVDCNNFYVSCERLFNPRLNNRPMVVATSNDGIIIARSNESKALGIGMAVPVFSVKEIIKKHKVIVSTGNFALYGDLSRRVFSVLSELSPRIEIYSIDEAFFVPPYHRGQSWDMLDKAKQIRAKLVQCVGIPVSVGLGPTKTLAKLANRIAKRSVKSGGVCSLVETSYLDYALGQVEAEDIWGVGSRSAIKLGYRGIKTALQFRDSSNLIIEKVMGVNGLRIARELRGEPVFQLEKNDLTRKGISSSRTFTHDVEKFEELERSIAAFVTIAANKVRRQDSAVSLLEVYLRTNRFHDDQPQYNNSAAVRLPSPSDNTTTLVKYARQALNKVFRPGYKYKKAGVCFVGLVPKDQVQSDLFATDSVERSDKLMQAMDSVNDQMGTGTLKLAALGRKTPWKNKGTRKTHSYTTNWDELKEVG